MSPEAALHSEVFRFYTLAVASLLLLATLILAGLRLFLKRDQSHAWRSLWSWLVMVPLVLTCLFLGRTATVVFLTLVAMNGFKEFARATGLYRDWGMTGVVYLGIVAVGVVSLVPDPFQDRPGWYGLFMALPVYVIGAILLLPIVRNRTQGQLQLLSLSILGFMYFGWMFGHLSFFANAREAYSYLLFIILAVELNDVAAYTFGKLWGRHRLRSNISPGKTWEGSLGALGVSLALPWLLCFTLPHFRAPELLLTGVIVGVGGQIGDLAVSVIKRDLGIKDMGALIPGHGGILDRIDSLIFTAPLFFHMVRTFHDIY